MDVIKRNFKGLYLFSLCYVLFSVLGLYSTETLLEENVSVFIYLMLSAVIYTGFQWYILNICRNNENEHIFKTVVNNSGWLVILSIIKNIVMYMLFMVMSIFLGIFDDITKQDGIFENILKICFLGMVTALFAFTEFIYYDKKDRGPLRAVFDSIKTTKKVYGRVFFIYLFILVYDVILFIYGEAAKENMKLGNILMIFDFIWMFAVYPLCYVRLCKIYDSVKKEESEINDSLEVVARALDSRDNDC